MPRDDAARVWRDMLEYLRRRHAPICRQWFEHLRPLTLDAGRLTIHSSNEVQRRYLQRQCLDQFTEAAQHSTGALVAVQFVEDDAAPQRSVASESNGSVRRGVAEPTHGEGPASWERRSGPSTASLSRPSPHQDDASSLYDAEGTVITPDYAFETFVTGPENQLAHAASVAVANTPGKAYNPLFIHGGVGLGKTHLLQAICQRILEHDTDTRICYLSCDQFMNQFVECVQNGQMSEFRHRYRDVDVLIIDDIHFLGHGNRERTQEEFFHTFNELYQRQKQIVLSSDSPPSEIPQLEARLVSRFQWGLVTPIKSPLFYETRVAIIQAKAQVRGIELPENVVAFIASRIDNNARELEGAITTVQGHAALTDRAIDLALAQEALGAPAEASHASQVTLQQIIDVVTAFYNVKLSDLQSKRRQKSITEPRQLCMWLARKQTRFSLEEIGGYFGGRDHTTVMHAIRITDERMNIDPQFAQQVQTLTDMIARSR